MQAAFPRQMEDKDMIKDYYIEDTGLHRLAHTNREEIWLCLTEQYPEVGKLLVYGAFLGGLYDRIS